MGLTFKIAVGVCFGSIAAFLAIKAPAWIEEAQRKSWYEDARRATRNMTPDLAIERCGKPLKDVFDRKNGTRLIYFNQDPERLFVAELTFSKSGPLTYITRDKIACAGLGLTSALRREACSTSTDFVGGRLIVSDEGRDNEAWNQLVAIPCLAGKQ
jgi:hypothetical protein